MKRLLVVLSLFAAGAFTATADASQVISTSSVAGLRLQVNKKGEALLTYMARGKVVHVLAWGAENAIPPTPDARQVAFRLDYSGGYAKYFRDNPSARLLLQRFKKIKGTPGYLAKPVVKKLERVQQAADFYWKNGFPNSCARYDGPPLAWAIAACKAPDGSYWAVQEWQRKLPDYGLSADSVDAAMEVHLSHWTGPLPVLTVNTDWAGHRWDHLYGMFTYDGSAVYGFGSTSTGQPLDSFGRNVYVDTFDSAYGPGWRRENSFLTHRGDGVFCYSVKPHGSRPAGTGTEYRATVLGPGVTPDVMWVGRSPGPYDRAADSQRNLAIAGLQDTLCHPN